MTASDQCIVFATEAFSECYFLKHYNCLFIPPKKMQMPRHLHLWRNSAGNPATLVIGSSQLPQNPGIFILG